MRARPLLEVALLAVLAGCAHDSPSAPPAPTPQALAAQALADSINAAGGRAFIGFKEAGTARGVDEKGRVLVSPETVNRMRQYVASQGITVEYASTLIPSVVARLRADGALVARLLAHPNIVYVEPIFPGTWAAR
jgi:hypothetical protein